MKLPVEKRIELMERFTKIYSINKDKMDPYELEITCLKQVFPDVFTGMHDEDLLVGRCIALPVGFSMEWAHLGAGDHNSMSRDEQTKVNGSSSPEVNSSGPSFYGIVSQLVAIKNTFDEAGNEELAERTQNLIEFWSENDTHFEAITEFKKDHDESVYSDDIHNFNTPLLLLSRLSGMQLDYGKIINLGVHGLMEEIRQLENTIGENSFYKASREALTILLQTVDHYIDYLKSLPASPVVSDLLEALDIIKFNKPQTFYSAIQLTYLYSQLAGVVNYGRMDEYLGTLLVKDLADGTITEEKALDITACMWRLIDQSCNRGNGRVIVGGEGRSNPEAANEFARLAIKATMRVHLPKPQLTLRLDDSTSEDVYDLGLDAIGQGCTFPMLYIDKQNVDGTSRAMDIPREDAQNYTPYGCGEYMIWKTSTGSPNACINFSKAMMLCFMEGEDAFDGEYRGGDFDFKKPAEITSFEIFKTEYYRYIDYLLAMSTHFQSDSYDYIAKKGGFIFSSILTDSCLERGKPLLSGGVKYRSGVCEFYGFSNAIDSLAAVKQVVFEQQQFTLEQVVTALKANFEGYEEIKQALLSAPKFGNDDDYVDSLAIDLHEHSCNFIRDYTRKTNLHSFLAVNINNNANTRWGIKTCAGFDGRVMGEHLSPGNNPHSGRDTNGITAMLNSVSKFDPDIHAGYVQNLKCSPKLMNQKRDLVKALFNGYFSRKGGTQLMVSVTSQDELQAAQAAPEKYQNLIVRCGGFSARFVELDINTQNEIIARTCNE